jgi:hypothetical protein
MTGIARLRAKLCEVSEFDNDAAILKKCNMTKEDLLEEDPLEKIMTHIGSE